MSFGKTVVLRHRSVSELPGDALALLERQPDIQLSPGWFRTLAENVRELGESTSFFVLRQDGTAVAVLPLSAPPAAPGQPRALHALANYYTSLYAPALARPSIDLAPLLCAAIRAHEPVHAIRLAPLDPADPSFTALKAGLEACGFVVFDFFCFGNWILRTTAGWNDFLSTRKGGLRSTLRRMDKRFDADGGRIHIVTGERDLEASIEAYGRVYAASWKRQEPYPGFVPGLMRHCAAEGTLRLGIAWLGDTPVASQFWIAAKGKADIYKVAYDERFKAYSPGTLLTARMMEHVLDADRVRLVDYLIGDDPYKKLWMSERRERRGLIAYNPRTVRGLWLAAVEAAAHRSRPLRHRLGLLATRAGP